MCFVAAIDTEDVVVVGWSCILNTYVLEWSATVLYFLQFNAS